jgi:hypothetical protein
MDETQLSLQTGDIICHVQDTGDGWSLGVLRDKDAYFPTAYAIVIKPFE